MFTSEEPTRFKLSCIGRWVGGTRLYPCLCPCPCWLLVLVLLLCCCYCCCLQLGRVQ